MAYLTIILLRDYWISNVIQFFVGRDHTYHVIYRSFSAVSLIVGRLLRCLDYVYV